MPKGLSRRDFAVGLTSLLAGCGASLARFPFDAAAPGPATLGLDITFYGVGCFRLSYKGVDVLSDPFWSYLPIGQLMFGDTVPDPKQVDPYLPELREVQTVIIGHNHYDHNLDLPYVAPHLHPDAVVVGSNTMVHTFAPSGIARPLVGLNDTLASPDHPGQWWVHPNGTHRVLPILSGHPTQYLFIHLFRDVLQKDRETPPEHVSDYQEGLTLAFLVDYLDDTGAIERRVYIQTSSTGYPAGFFPQAILDEHPVDVALLPMDCANLKMAGQSTIIDFLNAPRVFFCHWEDFFRTKEEPPREIVKVNLPKARRFFANTESTTYFFPGFDTRFSF
ncbi:MAG: hypothetical protein VXW32_14495 [Myxococcota bacterium]|nr:hypothetical protein [Myxococcota bacterium]